MSEINLTYCPEGGEHEWELWYDEEESKLVIDCDGCHQVAYSESDHLPLVAIAPLPVRLERFPHTKTLNVHAREA